MRKQVQVIPLQDIVGPPPIWWRLWYQLRARGIGVEKWHWCLAFALCTILAGSILLLCSINPNGLTMMFLISPGIGHLFQLLWQNTRKHEPVEALVTIYSAIGITGLAYAFYNSYS